MSLTSFRIGEQSKNRPLGKILFESLNRWDADWADLDDETKWQFQNAAKKTVRHALDQATPLLKRMEHPVHAGLELLCD